jgi:phosphatidylglycerophosphate synthase
VFDDLLRAFKDRILEPIARALGSNVSPTAVSVVSFLVGMAAALLLLQRTYSWALVCWLVNRVLDGLDGTLARYHGRTSDLGGYLDVLLDFCVYAAVPVALVAGAPSTAGFYALSFLLAAFYVNSASWMYLSAILERRRQGAEHRGDVTTVTMPAGVVAGTETILFYSAFILWPQHQVPLFGAMGILVLIGVVQRALWAHRHL